MFLISQHSAKSEKKPEYEILFHNPGNLISGLSGKYFNEFV